jgi:glycine C-acetyltransferase
VAAVTLRVLDLLENEPQLRQRLFDNTQRLRAGLAQIGLDLIPGEHPIIPVMIGDAARATRMADRLLELGLYVIGFSFPVVPLGKARIRTQMSAALSPADVDAAIAAFAQVARECPRSATS